MGEEFFVKVKCDGTVNYTSVKKYGEDQLENLEHSDFMVAGKLLYILFCLMF